MRIDTVVLIMLSVAGTQIEGALDSEAAIIVVALILLVSLTIIAPITAIALAHKQLQWKVITGAVLVLLVQMTQLITNILPLALPLIDTAANTNIVTAVDDLIAYMHMIIPADT